MTRDVYRIQASLQEHQDISGVLPVPTVDVGDVPCQGRSLCSYFVGDVPAQLYPVSAPDSQLEEICIQLVYGVLASDIWRASVAFACLRHMKLEFKAPQMLARSRVEGQEYVKLGCLSELIWFGVTVQVVFWVCCQTTRRWRQGWPRNRCGAFPWIAKTGTAWQ
jgi:hypothetical protein